MKNGPYAIPPFAWVGRQSGFKTQQDGWNPFPLDAGNGSFPAGLREWSLTHADNQKLTILQSLAAYSPAQFPFKNSDFKFQIP